MRIVIDNIIYSLQKIGGVSIVWYEITKRLLSNNACQCSFIEYDNAGENTFRKLLNIKPLILIQKSLWLKVSRYLDLKMRIDEPYIFHSTFYRLSRDKHAINITTVHDFSYERSGHLKPWNYLHVYQKRHAILNSDYVVCISENTKRDLFHYCPGVDKSRVRVIYNGVSDEYKQLADLDDSILPFPRYSYCIFVGVRCEGKNFQLALDSTIKAGLNFVMVGSPLTEEEIEMLDCTIGKGRYQGYSRIPNKELNILYNGALCVLYLSNFEGFGIPCVEAQKAGCPVVGNNSTSIPEVVCDHELLVDNLDVDTVCAVIDKLRNNEYRKQIVDKGVPFAKQFSWDRSCKELIQLYNEALKKKIVR